MPAVRCLQRLGAALVLAWVPCAGMTSHYPGTVDDSFRPDLGAGDGAGWGQVSAMAIQADGRLLVGGDLTPTAGQHRNRVVRLHPDGSMDASFRAEISKGSSFLRINALVVQPDARVLVAGWFDSVGGYKRYSIARLNSDGSLDPTFAPNLEDDSEVKGAVVLPNGRIVFWGNHSRIEGQFRGDVIRTGGTGKLDTSFRFDESFFGFVHGVLPVADSKYMVWGFMHRWNPRPGVGNLEQKLLYRIHENGSHDPSFREPDASSFEWPTAVAQQPDGRLLVVGKFSHIGEITRYGCARLLANGQLDTSFKVGGPNALVSDYPLTGHAVALQADGRILLLATDNTVHKTRLVRLLADGTPDPEFTSVDLAYGGSSAVMLSANDEICIGGHFDRVNGMDRPRLVRIRGGTRREAPLVVHRIGVSPERRIRIGFPAVPTHRYAIQATSDLEDWEVAATVTAGGDSIEWEDPRTDEFPRRFYQVRKLGAD